MSDTNSKHRIQALRCDKCGQLLHQSKYLCNNCGNNELSEISLNGFGEVYSYTIIRVPSEELLSESPYAFVEVELDEGLVVPGRMASEDMQNIEIGSRVALVDIKNHAFIFKIE